jgi:nitrate reductase NapE component
MADPLPSLKPNQPSVESKDASNREFTGWLMLFLLILFGWYPLTAVVSVGATVSEHPDWWTEPLASAQTVGPLVYWVLADVVLHIALACYGVYAGIRLLKIKPHAVRTAKVFLVAVFAYNLLLFVVTLIAEHQGNTTMDSLVKGELSNVVFALAWWAYLTTSDRVAAIFQASSSGK